MAYKCDFFIIIFNINNLSKKENQLKLNWAIIIFELIIVYVKNNDKNYHYLHLRLYNQFMIVNIIILAFFFNFTNIYKKFLFFSLFGKICIALPFKNKPY